MLQYIRGNFWIMENEMQTAIGLGERLGKLEKVEGLGIRWVPLKGSGFRFRQKLGSFSRD